MTAHTQQQGLDACSKPPSSSHVRQIRVVTVGGMLANILLSGAKLVGGLLGNSQAVVADAVHSFSDLSTDIAVLIGLKYWTAPADDTHPYGHRRIETMITAVIGLALASVGVGIAYNSLTTLHQQHSGSPSWLALLITVVSIVVKEGLYRWTVSVGSRIKSSAVVANAWHHRSDALSSLPAAVAVGIAMINPSWNFVDHIGAVVVALFILQAAWKITAPAAAELVDRGASQEVCRELHRIAVETPLVMDVHAVRTRFVASSLAVDMHVLVDPFMSVRDGHEVARAVKQRLLQSNRDVIDVVVHLEAFEDTQG